MSASITVQGFVATPPSFKIVGNNLAVSNFRLGSSTRRLNTSTGVWETTNTSWYSVSCFRELAINAFASLKKGDPIIVNGQLKVSEWSAGDKSGLDVEITADGIGHDLRWGKATGFARTPSKRGGAHDGEQQAPGEEFPSEPEGFTAAAVAYAPEAAPASGVADWMPNLSLGSATTADAGQPTAYGLIADAATGELGGGGTAELDDLDDLEEDEDEDAAARIPF